MLVYILLVLGIPTLPLHILLFITFRLHNARLHHYVGTYRKICLLVRIVPEDMPVSEDCGEHRSIF